LTISDQYGGFGTAQDNNIKYQKIMGDKNRPEDLTSQISHFDQKDSIIIFHAI